MAALQKYIKVGKQEDSLFDKDSFRLVWISQDKKIRAVMGKRTGQSKMEIQSYLFDKDRWNVESVEQWIKENKYESVVELYSKNKTLVVASTKLCSSLPNLSMGSADIHELEEKTWEKIRSQASLSDKYYFYTESVHEGPNTNRDYFFRDELVENYKSMSYSMVDWEHDRSQIIGFALDAQLVSQTDKPIAIGFNGIINRLSPYLGMEEKVKDDKLMSRDEIIRQRFFEGNLFMSMEVFFDAIQCTKCDYRTTDVFEFEHHVYSFHQNDEDVYRGLVGIDFIGNGLVQHPADSQADILSLRTSDDGTISVAIASEEMKNKYGNFADEITLAQEYAFAIPIIDLTKEKIIAIGKKEEEKETKNDEKDDIDKRDTSCSNSSYKGGNGMFKLIEKIAEAKSLSDIFVIAQETLKDYMGTASLKPEEITAFVEELSAIVKTAISEESFKVATVYSLTKEDKLEAISKAREEEVVKATEKENVVKNELTASLDKVKILEGKVEILEKDKKELIEAEAKKQADAKINSFIIDVEKNGVVLKDSMKKNLMVLAGSCKTDEELASLKEDLFVTIKQANLIEASNNNGNNSLSGNENQEDLSTKLKNVRELYKKNG